ncbi:hypothetical protein V5O48_016211, partial [Marasmius crinis-equi]
MVDQQGYRDFYDVVSDIIEQFELQGTEKARTTNRAAQKGLLVELKKRLKQEFKQASRLEIYRSEDVLLLVGNITKKIGEAPGLAPLKLAGELLSQIGDLVKTVHGNKAECTNLFNRVVDVIGDIMRKMQHAAHEPTEDMNNDIKTFERTLVHVRDHVLKIQQEKGWRRVARLVFAQKATEELTRLRKELETAQMAFVTSSVLSVRLELHSIQNQKPSTIVHGKIQAVQS